MEINVYLTKDGKKVFEVRKITRAGSMFIMLTEDELKELNEQANA